MISPETIQQIQSRVDIIDIVGNFVRLKKRGANYLGLCPFHNEKSPSFTVSPSKEIYKCFGCGKSGNSISFIMEHEKYSYVETLKWLANRYNVEIEETEVSPEVKQKQLINESLFSVNNFAKEYFTEQLFNTNEGQDIALSYLKHRGFREDIIKKFNLGYNPSSKDGFCQAALKAQYNKENLIRAGLIAERDDQLYDNYRGRIIFPIHNQSGKVLGFGARIIKNNDKAPKYINTPENEIYLKSKILYGTYFARHAIDKTNECLLVEGYTDVVSLHQAGIENVVASGGTALTVDQLRLVKKYTNNLTIIYDGDAAGVKAALRGLDLAIEEGLDVKLVLIPDKEDPDSYVNKVGSSGFLEFIQNNKKDFILFQLEVMMADVGNDTSKKSAVVNHLAETLSKMNKAEDFIKRQDYVRKISQLLKVEEDGMNELVNKYVRERINKFSNTQVSQVSDKPLETISPEENEEDLFVESDKHEQAVVRALIDFGLYSWDEEKTAEYIFRELEENEIEISNKDLVRLIELYKTWYYEGLQPTSKNFYYYDDPQISKVIMKVMDLQVEISPKWKDHYEGKIYTREDLFKEEVQSTLLYLKLKKIKTLIKENQDEFEGADSTKQLLLLQTSKYLKEIEVSLTAEMGSVILK